MSKLKEVFEEFYAFEQKYKLWDVKFLSYNIWAGYRRNFFNKKFLSKLGTEQSIGKRNIATNVISLFRNFYKIYCKKDIGAIYIPVQTKQSLDDYQIMAVTIDQENLTNSNLKDNWHALNYNNLDRNKDNIDLDILRFSFLYLGLIFSPFVFCKLLYVTRSFNLSKQLMLLTGDSFYYKYLLYFLKTRKVKVLILAVSYSHYPLIKACKNLGIRIVEVQHGAISKYHIGYAGVKDAFKVDEIITYDNLWSKQVRQLGFKTQSVSDFNIECCGTLITHFNEQNYNKLIIIGQSALTDELVNYYLECLSFTTNVYFRPHPSDDILHLESLGVRISSCSEIDFVESLDNANLYMGIYSTCLYEAIVNGCDVKLINSPLNDFILPILQEFEA